MIHWRSHFSFPGALKLPAKNKTSPHALHSLWTSSPHLLIEVVSSSPRQGEQPGIRPYDVYSLFTQPLPGVGWIRNHIAGIRSRIKNGNHSRLTLSHNCCWRRSSAKLIKSRLLKFLLCGFSLLRTPERFTLSTRFSYRCLTGILAFPPPEMNYLYNYLTQISHS